VSRKRTDLRRLPFSTQLAEVSRYHLAKVKQSKGSGGMEDPYITVDLVNRRFRCICAEGLLRVYATRASRAFRACILLPPRAP